MSYYWLDISLTIVHGNFFFFKAMIEYIYIYIHTQCWKSVYLLCKDGIKLSPKKKNVTEPEALGPNPTLNLWLPKKFLSFFYKMIWLRNLTYIGLSFQVKNRWLSFINNHVTLLLKKFNQISNIYITNRR